MAGLPYNPTAVLASKRYPDVVYVLDSPADASNNARLRGLNVSASLQASSLSFVDMTDDAPFDGKASVAYTAFISDNGTIYTLAGDCTGGPGSAAVWTFTPSEGGMAGAWAQAIVTSQEESNTTTGGANYLAGGVAFSSNVSAPADMYVFGGMCPQSTSETPSTWQSAADYSNALLHLEQSTAAGSSQYLLSQVGTRGPPIPEAGFSMTPLSPTYFNVTGGNDTMQQNYVLLGGHTQQAFINMSQVAVLSLPEETWTFVPVTQPSGATVDPRSGHTAILSETGQEIVLLGGWVGDVNTPAEPQLAVLSIGEGYGGSGSWEWAVPSLSGSGPSGGGLYGHGAALLPGNVLMVTGGVAIGSGTGELAVRSSSSGSYFFNITTHTWVSDYSNPTGATGPDSAGGANTDSKSIGLGAGLGLGLALLLLLIVLAFVWRRRRQRARNQEQKIAPQDLRALALGHNEPLRSPILGFGGIDGRGGAGAWSMHPGERGADAFSWAPAWKGEGTQSEAGGSGGAHGEMVQLNAGRHDAERTGLLVEIPSPTRGLRRSLHSRSHSYTHAWPDDGRRSRASTFIHRIDEEKENETSVRPELEERPPSNPFRDPSPPPSPLSARSMVSAMSQHGNAQVQSQQTPAAPQIKRRPLPPAAQALPPGTRPISAALTPGVPSPSSFTQLQAEGPALLHQHRPESPFDPEPRTPPKPRPRSWMGSMRRALAASASVASHSSRSTSPGGSGGGGGGGRAEGRASPAIAVASTGSAMDRPSPWARPAQGARAWSAFDPPIGDWGVPRSTGPGTDHLDEDEWDVEGAVERRVVQLMFTVPREKLRVINTGEGDAEEDDGQSMHSARSVLTGPESGPGIAGLRAASGEVIRVPREREAELELAEAETKIEEMDHGHTDYAQAGYAQVEAEEAHEADDEEEDEPNVVVHSFDDEEPWSDRENETEAEAVVEDGPVTPQPHHHNHRYVQLKPPAPTEPRPAPLVPEALMVWRSRRDAAVERLRQVSGDEAVEKVRKTT